MKLRTIQRKLLFCTLALTWLLTSCSQPAALTNEPELPFAQELQDALERGLEE